MAFIRLGIADLKSGMFHWSQYSGELTASKTVLLTIPFWIFFLLLFNSWIITTKYKQNKHKRIDQNHSQWLTKSEFKQFCPQTTLAESHKIGWVAQTIFKRQKTKFHTIADQHGLIVGSTGTGKTQKVIFPSVLYNAYSLEKPSMVVLDPKGIAYKTLKNHLKTLDYKVLQLDFVNFAGDSWNPFHDVNHHFKRQSWGKLDQALASLSNVLTKTIKSDKDPVWHLGAQNLLSGVVLMLLFQKPKKEITFKRLLNFLYQPMEDVLVIIQTEQKKHPALKKYLSAIDSNYDPHFAETLKRLIEIGLRAFSEAKVQKMCDSNEINYQAVYKEPTVLFIRMHVTDSTYWPLSQIFLQSLFASLIHNNNPKRAFLCFLDEFGNVPQIDNFVNLLATAREHKIWFLIAVQSLQQLQKYQYHHDIIANCGAKYYLHSNDVYTAEAFEKELGKTVKFIKHKTANQKQQTYYTKHEEPLMSYYRLMRLHQEMIIKLEHQHPYKIKSVPFYQWVDSLPIKKENV